MTIFCRNYFLSFISIQIAIVCFFGNLYAQQSNSIPEVSRGELPMAISGPNHVIVYLGMNALMPGTRLEAGWEGYQLYRAAEGEENFTLVNEKPIQVINDTTQLKEFLGPAKINDLMVEFQKSTMDSLIMVFGTGSEILTSFALFDLEFGRALGLVYFDENVEAGKTYRYKVAKIKEGEESEKSGEISVLYGTPPEILDPVQITASSADSAINLHILSEIDGRFHHVYNSMDKEAPFQQLTALPIVMADTVINETDSLVQVGETYYYTVSTEDMFGNKVFSDTIEVVALPPLPPVIPDISAELDSNHIHINWASVDHEWLNGYQLYRAIGRPDSAVTKLTEAPLPITDSVYADYNILPDTKYYYYVTSIDAFGQESPKSIKASLTNFSSKHPLPPTNLKATGLEDGVKLEWVASPSPDAAGYFVLRSLISTKDTANPIVISDILDATQLTYTDTAKVLSPAGMYAYYIMPMSHSGVEGPYSEPAFGSPNATLVPMPISYLTGSTSEFLGNVLEWGRTPDDLAIKAALYRTPANDSTQWQKVFEEFLSMGSYQYQDTTAQKGVKYAYRLVTVSEDGTESTPSETVILQRDIPLPTPPQGISAETSDNGINLNWLPNFAQEVQGYHIYRRTHKQGWQRITVNKIPRGTNNFEDNKTEEGTQYFYRLTCAINDELEGEPSETVSLER